MTIFDSHTTQPSQCSRVRIIEGPVATPASAIFLIVATAEAKQRRKRGGCAATFLNAPIKVKRLWLFIRDIADHLWASNEPKWTIVDEPFHFSFPWPHWHVTGSDFLVQRFYICLRFCTAKSIAVVKLSGSRLTPLHGCLNRYSRASCPATLWRPHVEGAMP